MKGNRFILKLQGDSIPLKLWQLQTRKDLAILTSTQLDSESLLYRLEQTARDISLFEYANKLKFMYDEKDGAIYTIFVKPLKLVDQFTYLGSNISSTENEINILIGKAWRSWQSCGNRITLMKKQISSKIYPVRLIMYRGRIWTFVEKAGCEIYKNIMCCFKKAYSERSSFQSSNCWASKLPSQKHLKETNKTCWELI